MGIEAFSTLASAGPALQVAGAFAGAAGAYSASAGTKAAYNAQAQIDGNNAALTDAQAADAIARGQRTVEQSKIHTRQTIGSQRAALAANGVDLSVGSAQHILNDTEYFGRVDANTITDNAAREAWGYRMQGANFRMSQVADEGRAGAESPWMAAGTSLLTSAGKVASTWYAKGKGG